ncbi:tetratricopeptide repeat protein [Flavobacterium pedocola]
MRQSNTQFSVVFLVMGFMLFTTVFYAQGNKKVDSIIKASTLEMYTNPDKVIATGKKIVNEAGNDIDIKIRGYRLISDGYSSKRDYQKSLQYVIKANELLPQSKNELLKIKVASKVAIQYHQLKIYDKAIQYLDQVERQCLDYPVRDSVNATLGTTYIVRGFIYKEKLNCDIAISFFDRGIDEIMRSKEPNINYSSLSIAKYNKGNCYLVLSNQKLAIKNFLESIADAKKINANSLQAFSQKGLAQAYTLEGKYKEAISLLKEANEISKNVNDLVLNQEIYKGLSENYLAMNEWDNYKEYRSKYLITQTQIKKNERKSVCDSLDEKDKDEEQKFDKDKSMVLWGMIIAFLLLVGIVSLFVRSITKSKITIAMLNEKVQKLQSEKLLRNDK